MSTAYFRMQAGSSRRMFLVIVCNGSLTEAVCRTMDREAGAMDGPHPVAWVRERAEV